MPAFRKAAQARQRSEQGARDVRCAPNAGRAGASLSPPAPLSAVTERGERATNVSRSPINDRRNHGPVTGGCCDLTVAPRTGHIPRLVAFGLLRWRYPITHSKGVATMKKIHAWLTVILMAVGLGLLAPGLRLGSLLLRARLGLAGEGKPDHERRIVTNVRTGQHYCFDRLVIDLKGKAGGYNVRYVSKVVQDGSGFPSSCGEARSCRSRSTRRPMTTTPARPPSPRPTGPR